MQRCTRGTRETYTEKRKIANKICRNKKKKASNKRLEEINNLSNGQNARELYRRIKQERMGFLDYIT